MLFRLHPSPRPRRALSVNGFGVKVFPKDKLHPGSPPILPILERGEARGTKGEG